ncbi:hypothetical protein ACMU_16250 [Actibacterium mucosum KCTC 23349]|uniref:DUF1203 domain-containing protein n=1 Tax=Actibacterium mucosum KCTC 23349 TaxID=1454373 RepID=A0A037ZGJ9_9RHOB|nr:DUF1203 domain-containing protein [Actibacterium mucosum]KAJ54666.1 hypothetical protein ACMU_16250 [Actibacterium mucosum KCTC 23349]
MNLTFLPVPTDSVDGYRRGAADANGQSPERCTITSDGFQCRHCLSYIPVGAPALVLAHRPFADIHPYAECGPVFVCAQDCAAFSGPGLPEIFAESEMLVRGYGADERIVYGTGQIAPAGGLQAVCAAILADEAVAFVHVRSARNNCYQARVERAG